MVVESSDDSASDASFTVGLVGAFIVVMVIGKPTYFEASVFESINE
jgi:hypothetical protein